jgi:two-component system NtrC family sensor kinase
MRENGLWRLTLVVLFALAGGLALVSWQELAESPWKLGALPIGLVVLVGLFGSYALAKTREIAELRGLVRGLEQRATIQPAVGQVEKLFDLVQRSQQGYRDLIDTFDDLLFSLSDTGEILAANRSFADVLGHSFSELVGRQLDEFVDLGDGTGRAAAEKALPRFLERRHWSGVLRLYLKRDSSIHYFQCTLHTLVRGGQDQGICVLARDVTKERENEARFTELFETLQEGVYVAGPEGKFESVNPALARLLGYDQREEMLDRPLSDFVLEREQWEAQQRLMTQSGSIHAQEVTLRRRDGSPVTCLHAAAFVRDTAGRIRRQQGTLLDITERREMEQRLHREQEFARRLVESFPDLVVATDREGRYTFVSPRSRELLGFAPEEMVGSRIGERMDTRDRGEVRALFDAIVSGQCPNGGVEYRIERKDGELRLFKASASALLDALGRIEGVIAAARDITESKRMEQQLIQTERLAAMGQMIAGVAHELNNPLTAVLGITELMQETAADDTARRHLELAHGQARRAAEIVQSLLSFSRPPQPRKTCLQLSDLIQRSLQLHEHSLRSNNIAVDFVAKPDLPVVLGDASQLTQVFLNLIANAEQAINEARDHGTLRIRLGRLGDRVLATFQDDGVGIRREILSKIFDPFFTTKRPGRGTGLGLSICLAILREHNGQIEAQPLSDGGAVFTVSLPVAAGTATFLAESAPSSSDSPAPIAEGRLNGYSVLVVDDEESIRELVRDGLSARGASVDVAATSEEALVRVTQQPYDAILCDLNLSPGDTSSGREFRQRALDQLNAMHGRVKPLFLFMTGDLVDRAAAENTGDSSIRTLQKPFRISELIAILSETLSSTTSIRPRG